MKLDCDAVKRVHATKIYVAVAQTSFSKWMDSSLINKNSVITHHHVYDQNIMNSVFLLFTESV